LRCAGACSLRVAAKRYQGVIGNERFLGSDAASKPIQKLIIEDA
jgi:hypothetical protein